MRLSIIPYLSFILILLFLICEIPAFYSPDDSPNGIPIVIIDNGIIPGFFADTTKVVCKCFIVQKDYFYVKLDNSDRFLTKDRYDVFVDEARYRDLYNGGE